MNPIFTAILPLLQKLLGSVIGKYLPDPAQQAQAQLDMIKLLQSEEFEHLHADTQLALAQIDLNKTEAANPSLLVAGWRPALGWVCVISLGSYYIPYAVMTTVVWIVACIHTGQIAPHPDMGTGDLLGLVATMLGSSVIRSMDKSNGVDTKQIGN